MVFDTVFPLFHRELRKPLELRFCFKLKLNKNALDPGPTTINGDSVVTHNNSVGDPLQDTFSQLNLALKIVVMGKNERTESEVGFNRF